MGETERRRWRRTAARCVTGLVAVVAVEGAAAQEGPSGLDGVAFLGGCWRGPLGADPADYIEERWGPAVDNLVLGTTVYVRGGRAVQFEFAELTAEGDGPVLTPYPGGRRSEHSFSLTAADGAGAVFEAPGHDYPKRIVYRSEGPDRLVASIDGGADDPEPRTWRLERVPCGPETRR